MRWRGGNLASSVCSVTESLPHTTERELLIERLSSLQHQRPGRKAGHQAGDRHTRSLGIRALGKSLPNDVTATADRRLELGLRSGSMFRFDAEGNAVEHPEDP